MPVSRRIPDAYLLSRDQWRRSASEQLCGLFRIVALLASMAALAGNAAGQEDQLVAPVVSITAPRGQTIFIVARYFNDGKMEETKVERVEIESRPHRQQLDGFYDGLHLRIQTAAGQSIRVELFDGARSVAEQSSERTSEIDLRVGEVPADDRFDSIEVLPSPEEQTFIERFVAALAGAESAGLVLDAEYANLDAPTLDAFMRAVTDRLGSPQLNGRGEDEPVEGWVAWDGSMGTRILAGGVPLERGQCRFQLTLAEGSLIAVEPSADALPDDWYAVDDAPELYRQQSQVLFRAILHGDTGRARDAFAARYRDEILPEALTQLHRRLRQRFPAAIVSISHSHHELLNDDSQLDGQMLSLYAVARFEDQQACLAKVDFLVTTGPEMVGRGYLKAIHFTETWESACPEQHQTLLQFLSRLDIPISDQSLNERPERSPTGDAPLQPDGSAAIFDSQVLGLIPVPRIESVQREVRNWIHESTTDQRVSLETHRWTYRQNPSSVSVKGPISIGRASETSGGSEEHDADESGSRASQADIPSDLSETEPPSGSQATLRASFIEDRLVGISIRAPRFFASTFDLLPSMPELVEHGERFWQHLLAGEIADAHKLLAEDFRQQLSVEALAELYGESDLAQAAKPQSIRFDHLRLSDSSGQAGALRIACFYIAEFEGASFQPLRCEFRVPSNGQQRRPTSDDMIGQGYELLDFETDFEAVFAVESPESVVPAQRFLKALSTGSAAEVVSLVHPADRDSVDEGVLDGFLAAFQELSTVVPDSGATYLEHDYRVGLRRERLLAELPLDSDTESSIPVEASFEFGFLKSFFVRHPSLDHFANRIDQTAGLERLLKRFVIAWLREELADCQEYLVSELRRREVVERLRFLRNEMRVDLGPFRRMRVESWEAIEGQNRLRGECLLVYREGSRQVAFTVRISAFWGLIDSIVPAPARNDESLDASNASDELPE